MKDFKKKYNDLPQMHKGILQLLCFLNEPIARSNIYNGLRNNRIFKKYGIKLSANNVGLALQRLIADGFVTLEKKYFSAVEEVIVPVCRYLTNDPEDFEAISKTVRENKYIAVPEKLTSESKVEIRTLRNTILRNNWEVFLEQYEILVKQSSKEILNSEQIKDALFKPFQSGLLTVLPPEKQFEIFFYYLSTNIPSLEKMDNEFTDGFGHSLAIHPIYREWANVYLILKGDINKMFEDPSNGHYYNDIACQAISQLIAGAYDASYELFTYCLKLYRSTAKDENSILPDFPGIFHVLAILKSRGIHGLQEAYQIIRYGQEHSKGIIRVIYICLRILVKSQKQISEKDIEIIEELIRPKNFNLGEFFAYFTMYMLDRSSLRVYLSSLEAFHQKAVENNYQWIALETAIILKKMGVKTTEKAIIISSIEEDKNIYSILPFDLKNDDWKNILAQIQRIHIEEEEEVTKSPRLAWQIDLENKTIFPIEQRLGVNSTWSKGRKISLQRLKEEGFENSMSQDKTIIKCIKLIADDKGNPTYYMDTEKAFPLLAEHPFIYTEDNHVELELGKVTINITKVGNYYIIKTPEIINHTPPVIIQETKSRFKVYEINRFHQQLRAIINGDSFKIPEKYLPQLKQIFKRVRKYVNVNYEYIQDTLPVIEYNKKTIVRIRKNENKHFIVELFVKPIEHGDLYFKPGVGTEIVSGNIDHIRVKTKRYLDQEILSARELVRICPVLSPLKNINKELIISNKEELLELLLQLRELSEFNNVEWIGKDEYRVIGSASNNDIKLKINKYNNWFELQGILELPYDQIFPLKEVLQVVTNDNERFIEISKNLFVAVTEELKKTLQKINLFTQCKDNRLLIHPQASLAFENIKSEIHSLITDEAWREKINSLKSINEIMPSTPEGLNAELREYQREGFQWLSRLYTIGVGACLADEMGLGKTLQAITMILDKASEGPSLVVAPASLCFNWINEINKFTDDLNPIKLDQNNRTKAIKDLKQHDVLVISYGLLQSEVEELKKIDWVVTILDEAHAIKNYNTKRAGAAQEIKSDFKLITTGTPIQNNLNEIWSLFEFINPNLLGTQKDFSNKFGPTDNIEENHARRESLKRIMKPYILRRTKDQVLKELPPKTESTLFIDLSEEEVAFYNTIKEKAIKALSDQNAEKQTMQILAELTRLRLASCNTKLVNGKSEISSSKLNTLDNLLTSILDANHKVIIFSQFTTHLNIIKRHLEKQKLNLLYMDGKTPMSKREKLVKTFQDELADVFLISLKTGGVGLNLTAADYVIHMDPWWNPSVEDQASDRVHRIGQDKPVTIYKLIARNTIEEKIIELHKNKIDLANQLLRGTDKISSLSSEDLFNLLKIS
ncbi:MAG: DEAD/DEAH box helicase [Hyphomicrobiales bacterium]